jgi:hypothetical protein
MWEVSQHVADRLALSPISRWAIFFMTSVMQAKGSTPLSLQLSMME